MVFPSGHSYAKTPAGDHGSTFGGNPLATAAANAAVRFMVTHEVPNDCLEIGRYFKSRLESFRQSRPELVSEIRGMGLLLALVFSDTIARDVVSAANEQGLLLNPVRPDAIRFMPPLIITESDVDEAMDKLESAVRMVVNT